ncbi:MAG: RNA polymerase sigma factor RpoH [Magnetococcales bacterium]|nr:RNA polymerase sigma factor RpoH [Magnetococcales bacterium]
MSQNALIPYTGNQELSHYIAQLDQVPLLAPEEEYDLAVRYREEGDLDAAHQLVVSYLRYVAKIAREYQHYGLRMMDLVQEGSIGLMQAVKKFNPYKGFRLSTYAVWWIKAAIQEFILRSWSLVKIGTTTAQRKLFFNLRKSKKTLERLDEEKAQVIGEELGVSTRSVLEMDGRLSGPDDSLNRASHESGEEVQNLLADPRTDQETRLLESEEKQLRQEAIATALETLNERERQIIQWRIMTEKKITLEEISKRLKISRERVRQLESKALIKLRRILIPGLEGMALATS